MPCLGFLGKVLEKKGISVIGVTEFIMVLGANSPALIFWIAVIVLAAIVLGRGGGRAERFLIAGAGIKITGNLLNIPMVFIIPWLVGRGYSQDYAISAASNCGIFLNVVGMAGIICLVYAFWVKFKARDLQGEATLPQN